MQIFNIYIMLSSFFSIFFQILSYKELSGKEINFTLKKCIMVLLIFWFIILNNAYNIELLTAPVGFILLLCVNYIVYGDDFNCIINITTMNYLLAIVVEIILSVFIMKFDIFTMDAFKEQKYLTLIFTVLTMCSSYIMCRYIKTLKFLINKINSYTYTNTYKIFLIILFVLILLIIDFKYVGNFDVATYLINIILLVSMLILFVAYLYGEIRIDKEIHKIDILLNNISKYEKIIDNNRINNHEMLNNLLILKSIKNKNTKKYDKILDDMIMSYDNGEASIRNISILPKGIKGIVYYKLDEVIQNDIKIFINISKQISGMIEKINHDEYIILCKIIPILLDNAIESSKNSKEKNLLFDIYKENSDIVISIENSTHEDINLCEINNKYFSTKGQNRGLGLHIVNNLLSKSKKISLSQFYNNKVFVSKLIIKK